MSERQRHSENSLDVIQPFVECLGDAKDVQIMGGIGTAALGASNVEFHCERKEVVIPGELYLPVFRAEDGTKRDVDVLVLSSNPDRTQAVSDCLDTAIGETLERSVFGIRPHEALQAQLARPLGWRAFRTFLSDRYEASAEGDGQYIKSLFPFAVPIHPESLETWSLLIGNSDNPIPIPHPGTTIANYTNRSISGLRPRDREKIAAVTENVFEHAPGIKEWLLDGPGKSQVELSRVIASLRHPHRENVSLVDGLRATTYSHAELAEHQALMTPEHSYAYRRTLIAEAAFKASALYTFEDNPSIVTLWRKVAEKRADVIVKNM